MDPVNSKLVAQISVAHFFVAHFSVAQISVAHFSVAHFTIYRKLGQETSTSLHQTGQQVKI